MLPDTRTAGQPIWVKCFKAMLGEYGDNDNETFERGKNVDFLK